MQNLQKHLKLSAEGATALMRDSVTLAREAAEASGRGELQLDWAHGVLNFSGPVQIGEAKTCDSERDRAVLAVSWVSTQPGAACCSRSSDFYRY